MEFRRQLSVDALEYLGKEGSFIIPEIKAARNAEPFSLDIQIRKNDEVMVYMGNSCILTIKLRTQTGQIVFEAHQTYSDAFLGTYLVNSVPNGAISKYLELTIPKVNGNFYGNQKEGYYQNILCYKQGENPRSLSPFVIFDRECVPGFRDIQERVDIFNPIVEGNQDIRIELQNGDPIRFGYPYVAGFGTGLDFLAIDEQCNLICIELKHGNNSSGICWGGLQLAVYHELFNTLNALDTQTLFCNIKELIEQKVILGLLPENVMSCFNGKDTFNSVKSCLVVAEPNFRMNCWDKMRGVISAIPVAFRCKVLTMDNDCKFSIYL